VVGRELTTTSRRRRWCPRPPSSESRA
jgi:hypothetical protein